MNLRDYRRKRNMDFSDHLMALIYVIVLLIFAVSFLMCLYRPFNKISNQREITATVTDKTVKNSGDNGKYLVFTEDENGQIAVFEVSDSLLMGRFDSSDDYAGIKVGCTYTFTVCGSRIHYLSWYPNIYEYKMITDIQIE